MNNKMKLLGIALVVILALAALGAGVAFAQTRIPNNGFGPGSMMGGRAGMMNGNAQNGDSWEWMDAMHDWMTASGGMHTFIWNALAEKLGMTSDELYAAVNGGKTITQIAETKGVSRADLVAALETAHKNSLAQAVTNGALTQAQADSILAQMSGRYEWMLDNMGSAGMMGGQFGAGGMMNGQAGNGGCHGNWNGSTTDQQPKP